MNDLFFIKFQAKKSWLLLTGSVVLRLYRPKPHTYPFPQSDEIRKKKIGSKGQVKCHHSVALVAYCLFVLNILNVKFYLFFDGIAYPFGKR